MISIKTAYNFWILATIDEMSCLQSLKEEQSSNPKDGSRRASTGNSDNVHIHIRLGTLHGSSSRRTDDNYKHI